MGARRRGTPATSYNHPHLQFAYPRDRMGVPQGLAFAPRLVTAQHRPDDIGGAQRGDLLRQVRVVGAGRDKDGVAGFHGMHRVPDGLLGAFRPAPVIGVVAGPRIDIPLHGKRTSEAADTPLHNRAVLALS